MIKYSKVEFWISLALFVLAMFGASEVGSGDFHAILTFDHRSDMTLLGVTAPYWLAVVGVYLGFLAVNYYVVPKFALKQRVIEAFGLTFLVLLMVSFVLMITSSYNHFWTYNLPRPEVISGKYFGRSLVFSAFGLTIYIFYFLIREFIIYQHTQANSKQNMASRVVRQIILVCSVWFAVILPLLLLHDTGIFNVFFAPVFIAAPYCFIIYFLNLYWLIPGYKQGKFSSGLVYFAALTGVCLGIGFIEVAFLSQTYRLPMLGNIIAFWLIPTPIIVYLSWWTYQRNEAIYQQLTKLQTALGNTNTNLQYLRSQINPHFLFNALNTLYGTALMEKADKTGEGIQKLGDMMRFMLHENNQDKIALSRELDYLHNYIDLQNMRLALSPDLAIDIQIEDIVDYYEIAPMLLIPFVENAYKHGVSLQQKSWINVDLYKRDNVLHLDVRNSVHPININDPERDQSGTGLDNVKQRLQLMYPDRHELVIRQNAREFFIHLSLTLTTQTL